MVDEYTLHVDTQFTAKFLHFVFVLFYAVLIATMLWVWMWYEEKAFKWDFNLFVIFTDDWNIVRTESILFNGNHNKFQ